MIKYRALATITDSDHECDGSVERREGLRRGPASHRGAGRRDLIFPEKIHSIGPVELVCTVGTQRFAFEHTRIEPFVGHIQLEAEAKRHFQPITDAVVAQLPVDSRFELEIPAGAMLGLNDRAARPIQGALVRWILATAPTLPTARPGRYALPIQRVTPTGVPFAVSLHRWSREGFPFPFLIREGEVETKRLSRITDAYHRKLAKLMPWGKAGARTILIFEEDDIFLTNHFNVADALLQIEASRAERPDEVYLVTVLTSRWMIVRLRVGDITLYDMQVDDRFWETQPDSLINVTGPRRAARPAMAP
jgi:hypothetical protein